MSEALSNQLCMFNLVPASFYHVLSCSAVNHLLFGLSKHSTRNKSTEVCGAIRAILTSDLRSFYSNKNLTNGYKEFQIFLQNGNTLQTCHPPLWIVNETQIFIK